MSLVPAGDGNTPLTPEEEADLIPNLATREELNQWERANILIAFDWALDPRSIRRQDPLTESYVRRLHRRMFDETWRWAGVYRTTERNFGISHHQIREAIGVLLGDAHYWMQRQTYPPDEIAIRLHHRMVVIHPFANGNGRHARLLADVLARKMGRSVFSWGAATKIRNDELRRRYIHALRMADQNEIVSLVEFARS